MKCLCNAENIDAMISIVGTLLGAVVGTLLGWILNSLSQHGKLRFFVASWRDYMAKEYKNNEMAEKVVAIQDAFFEFREELESIKEENRKLKDEIARLTDVSVLEEDLELSPKGYYVRKSEQDAKKEIHYCPACWQNHKKLMPLVRTIGGAVQCTNCHTLIR